MKDLIPVTQNKQGQQIVSAKDLYLGLGLDKSHWKRWSKKNIVENEYFQENIDWVGFTMVVNGNETQDFTITLEFAKDICRKQRRNLNAGNILKYLLSFDNKEVMVIEPKRKEIQFAEMLDKITGFKWHKQYPIDNGKYRLDFYLEDILIVEYDEEYHKWQKEKDNDRIEYCREWLALNTGDCYDDGWRCPVIIVKEGEELEGLNRIIRHLAGLEEFDTQWDYDLSVCDYKHRKLK